MSTNDLGRGFDPAFLGASLHTPLPRLGPKAKAFAWREGEALHYEHFSIVMNAERRIATYTAHNLDGAHLVMSKRGNWWDFDPRLPRAQQIGGEFYRGTHWDRGHLVRRRDVVWGRVEEARRANRHTFFFTNAAPQHHNFNTDEWLLLEDWILDTADQEHHRLNVFTGPVFREDDLEERSVRVPAGFWKVVVRGDPRVQGGLSVVAVMMKQNAMWQDTRGAELLQLEVHQVSVQLIEELTDIDMGPLRASDELSEWVPRRTRDLEGVERVVWPVIRRPEDLVLRSSPEGWPRPLGLPDQPTGRRVRGMDTASDLARVQRAASGAETEARRLDIEALSDPTPGVEPLEIHRPPAGRRTRALEAADQGIGPEELERHANALIEAAAPGPNADLVRDLVLTGLGLARDGAERRDLWLLSAALRELRLAFATFAPHAHRRKVTIFGSARTPADHPAYEQARELAARMVTHGYQVVTGGGPGIMSAGNEGAGTEHGFALDIALPFEQAPNEFVAADKRLHFRYFFTRKLCLVKEADAVVACPGGFGTQDELFETLTLVQTGRSCLIPIVLLEPPGADHWQGWLAWVRGELLGQGLISPEDLSLFRVATGAEAAETEILRFYRRYHSSHQAGPELVLRLQSELPDVRLEELQREFGDLLRPGAGPIRAQASAPAGSDAPELAHLPRLVLPFDRRSYGRLRELVDRINS